jgi:hypothetical protein
MRTRSWAGTAAGLLAATVAVLTAGAAQAVTPGETVPDGAYPFAAEVAIGDQRSCSGALIAPQWVLTATACFSDGGQPVAAGPPALPTTVRLAGGPLAPVTKIVPHPDRGVTLAKLPLRLTDVTPIAPAAVAPGAGDVLQVAGYGRTATEWVPDALHAGTATVRDVTPATLALTGATTCKGDAGGPVMRVAAGHPPELAGLSIASGQRGCLGASGTDDGSTAARLDDLTGWIAATTAPPLTTFGISYAGANGVGTFDLGNTRDLTVPYDYEHSGKQDYVLTYRPGSRYVAIARHNADNTFTTVFSSANGIGGFDLALDRDRIVPFDYAHTGKLDHLLIYRPGSRIAYVIRHNPDNTFGIAYAGSNGIGGYDLAAAGDQVIAFDYDHSGKQDHLLAYRPGSRIAYVIKHNADGSFGIAYASTTGIGGFDLATTADRIVPFDYDHTGKLDTLLVYRPGQKIVFMVKHTDGNTFSTVWSSFTGLPGFDLGNTRDLVTPYDYDYTGKADHLVFYRPGNRLVVIYRHGAGTSFTAVYSGTNGIGGYDLAVPADRIVAYDADHSGGPNSLLLTRPGNKIVYVVGRQSAEPATPPAGTVPG